MFTSEMSDRPAETQEKRDSVSPHGADGWAIVSLLLSGILLWGGIGWIADALLDFDALFLPIGMVLGMVGAIYVIWRQAPPS